MYNIFLQEEVHGSCELWESTGAEFCWSKHGKSWSERSVDKWKTLWQGKMKMGFSYTRSKMFWGPVSWKTRTILVLHILIPNIPFKPHSKYVKCQKGSKYPFLWVLFTKHVATFGNSTSKMDPTLFLKISSLTLWLGSGWMWPTQVPTFQHQWMVLGSHFSHHGTNKRVHWKKIQCLVTNWPSGKISAWWYSEEWWIWSTSMCCSPW